MSGLARRAARAWQTIRHVPPGQLLRRAELVARFRAGDVLGRQVDGPAPALADRLPAPLFPPRPDLMRVEGERLVLCLPWGERAFARPLPWRPTAAAGEGSVKADLNNLHFMEYLESLDEALLVQLVEDWIEKNPPGARRAWRYPWRPYNLALRTVAWFEELARRRDRLPEATLARMTASLAAQLRFLERHLETDLRGNHLIKNIRALAWGGACLAGPEADRWRALAIRLLRRELAEQVLPDGCHYERSPAYHCQVLEDLLACRAALAEPLPELDAALQRMTRTLLRLTHPDGRIAPFNDGGLSMARAPAELLAAWKRQGGTPPAPEHGPFALPDGGYYGLQARGELLLVDCGPLGPAYLPGHGHCDLLAVEWSTGGRRILVDQGTHQYVAGPRRLLSRRTASHNTVALAGVEQSDIYGAFRCGRRARPELRAFEPQGQGFRFVGSHDGFAHLPGRPRHVRTIEAVPGRLAIDDRLEAGGEVPPATAGLLLHPDCALEVDGRTALIRSGPVVVRLEASAPLRVEPAEWYPDIHVALPTQRLVLPVPAGGMGLDLRLRRVDGA